MTPLPSPRSRLGPQLSSSLPSSPLALDAAHRFTFMGLSPVVIAVVSSVAWMTVSSGLILLNKDLLSTGFPYPMALSGLGMAFSAVASYVTCHHLKLVEAKRAITSHFFVTHLLPVGLCMALTLHFGNLVYLYLTVSFIQILKCFTPVITMLALFAARLETPSRRLVASVLCIALGTAVASAGAVNFSATGVAIMLASETFEAVRLVMTQILLTGLKFHPIEGLMYLAPACLFWLLLGSLAIEVRPMLAAGALSFVAAHPLKFIAAAAMGFGVNSLAYIVIQTASSLTLKVLGTAKNAVVVWLGIVFLHETVTATQGVGYGVSVAAFGWYNRIKMGEIASNSQPGTPAAGLGAPLRGGSGTFSLSRGGSGKYEAVPLQDMFSDSRGREPKEQV